jgi:hypothetical protein
MYGEDGDGNCTLVGEPIRDGALIIRRMVDSQDQDHFVLMLDCILKIAERLDLVIEGCEDRKARLTAEIPTDTGDDAESKRAAQVARGRVAGLEGKLAKLEQLKSLSQLWARIVRTLSPLPRTPERPKELDPKLLWVYHERTFAGKWIDSPPIVLNIRSTKASLEETPVTQSLGAAPEESPA